MTPCGLYSGECVSVTFPSGTIVDVSTRNWLSDINLDVYVYPSAADENSTRGLCGYLDGQSDSSHDFLMPDGNTTTSSLTFARSWRLTEDYFIDPNDLDKFDNLESWTRDVQLCVCPRATLNGTDVPPPLRVAVSELHCSYKEYIGKCQSDRTKPFECFLKTQGSKRRKRRDLHTHCYNVPEINNVRIKRQVPYVVSETEARTQCENAFNASISLQGCSENIDGLYTTSMDSCISDYQITGEQFVITSALDSLKDTCVSIIGKDVELQSSNPALVGEVFNNTCLNDCSGQGQCENGYCKCNPGFAGTDCSYNIENPPIITSVKVLCDTLDDVCDTISIYGRNFLNTNSFRCQVSSIQTLVDGTSVFEGSSTVNGTQRSPFEAICPLQKSVSSSSTFVYSYNVSISNDGVSFSNISEVYVYNSLCQEMIDSSGTTVFNLMHKIVNSENQKPKAYKIRIKQEPKQTNKNLHHMKRSELPIWE
ncbi:hypothetical protein FSP39_009739 [Pinctada imbricata]|uniref:VWFD domain-containing protein n=1 Tax=Pinctada imbricata TaxID=66713 RepID=A0AA89BZA5_PINIB|nr:hypothetical protein FSP39_009739 [Pinctada imbricata]